MTNPYKYVYRCHHCKEESKQSIPTCKICGPNGKGHFELDPLTSKVSLICEGCNAAQTVLTRPPINCLSCHQGVLDWWDSEAQQWAKLDLSVQSAHLNNVWITGDFDGDYEGILQPQFRNQSETPGNASIYDIEFKHSYLKNARKIDGPPLAIGPEEVRPFTRPLIFPVDVQTPLINDAESNVSRVALKDFRLHHWEFVGSTSSAANEDTKRFGRIKGVGYGVLQEKEPEIEKPDDANNGVVGQAVNQVREFTKGPQIQTEVADGQTLVEPEYPYDSCLSCSTILHLILAALIWMTCTWKIAALFLLFMMIVCWLDGALGRNDLQIKNKLFGIIFGLLLLIASGLGLTIGYWPRFITDCHELSQYALIVSALAFLFSSFLRSCFVKTLLLAFLFFALCSWCKIHDRSCKFNQTNSIQTTIDAIKRDFEIITDSDINSNIINDISENNPDGKYISIDQVTNKPELLDDCNNKIYIPFGFNSSEIDANNNIKLYRLGMILRQYDPERIIISGYASKDAGDETPVGFLEQIRLSEERSNNIKQYLVDNEFISADKIETRGLGYSVLILPKDPANTINRRVEVNIQCKVNLK